MSEKLDSIYEKFSESEVFRLMLALNSPACDALDTGKFRVVLFADAYAKLADSYSGRIMGMRNSLMSVTDAVNLYAMQRREIAYGRASVSLVEGTTMLEIAQLVTETPAGKHDARMTARRSAIADAIAEALRVVKRANALDSFETLKHVTSIVNRNLNKQFGAAAAVAATSGAVVLPLM